MAVFGQVTVWSPVEGVSQIQKNRFVQRQSFPAEFELFSLNRTELEQKLFSVVDTTGQPTVISLPNAYGRIEQFEVFEASNFEPELQAKFPDIRAFSGRGLTDIYATVKLSISPQGVQSTVFRSASGFMEFEGQTEILEPYSEDSTIYAVFKSARKRGELPWACNSPVESAVFTEWKSQISPESQFSSLASNSGEIRTLRLAQSNNGEYANYFGATSSAQVGLVLAAFNATLTRVNGVFEKDFGVHLNLIPETTNIIFYDPATDPYTTTLSAWNNQLRDAIRNNGITVDMYDIGHMFGADGGGGNAGCIGCVCSTNTSSTHFGHDKGRGITSPADGIPYGDNFDIDYVAHEIGHQLGANHTFSIGALPVPEMFGQDKEVGSGITIMSYAGITEFDAAPHSIDVFHATSIEQVQRNLPTRGCPANGIMPNTGNRPPVVAAVNNYTIPMLTPFALTGSAADPDGDPITYNWEQNDSSQNLGATGAYSTASPVKPIGPNWLSFPSTSSPTKYFPRLSTILAGQFTTAALPGGDPTVQIEALSSIPRDLNFRLTVRDNHPYVPGTSIGQTQYEDVTVSVTDLAGPFKVAAPDTAVTWEGGTHQNIIWLPANTNLPPVNTLGVNIRLSVNGGRSFPIVLKANTLNDGIETVVIPRIGTSSARIMVEAAGNIFFDISDAGFNILGPTVASVGGRTLDRFGRRIKDVVITLTSPDGTVRTVVTDSNGFYTFDAVPLGEAYVISASHRRYRFTPENIEYVHIEQKSDQDFMGTNK